MSSPPGRNDRRPFSWWTKALQPAAADEEVIKGFTKDQESLVRGRVGIILIIGAALVPFFGWVDYILYPEHFIRFMSYRMIASFACLVLYFVNSRWDLGYKSIRLGVIGFYVVGFTIIAMVVESGGYVTPYYAGLNLVFLTFCTVLTVRVTQLALHSAILYAAYVCSVLVFSRSEQVSLFLANNMFVLATVVIILVASFVNDRLRWKEYLLRKELQAAQEELMQKEHFAALGKLIATVSHEIRNPLGTIRTSLFSINERVRGKGLGVERALDRAERNIVRCDRIIDELLGYSRDRELDVEATALDEWLAEVLYEQTLPEGIILERNLASGAVLEFDKERLRRSVLNVISNACQAMVESAKAEELSESDRRPNGRLRVETRIAEERAEIVVNDSGGGIPVEELGRVFQPLYSTKGFGVGLGLTIVKRIMERHGGGVEIESSPQAGTTVILWLPIKRPQPNRLAQRRRDAEKTNV